ncbi:right-handed parallel beta-helix repeat-containing protein [Nocardioides sp.]|uniref:right-handed parallel beta-helix repeat-containing protein n=1 Tax=Nocardioides sp. TaxID=35761 RepID=UPI0035B43445
MTHYFVTAAGDNTNSGTSEDDAFRDIVHAVARLEAGDTLSIGSGVYREQVVIEDKRDILIQSIPGEQAVIDGSIPTFAEGPAAAWARVGDSEEFVSRAAHPEGTRFGAILGPRGYVRLITYDHLDDLRAENQKFGPVPLDDGPDGPEIVVKAGQPRERRPWVYLGPGLHQTPDGIVHVRLSHTNHHVDGVTDYTGEIDPREADLAVWTASNRTFQVKGSSTVTVENLTVRCGGGRTVLLTGCSDVTLDHVTVQAGPYALEVGQNCVRTRITNCTFDGGMPPWYFRSDRKDGYTIRGSGVENGLGEKTVKTLVYCHRTSGATTFDSCEFTNAHDLQLNGPDVVFSRNWVRNINDDALFVGDVATNLRISRNVFQKCLMVVSVAGGSAIGSVFVHRNLVDLRSPTAGRRPVPDPALVDPAELPVMRFGNLLKSNAPDPALFIFHNTVLVVQAQGAVHNLFRSRDGSTTRRAFNNIFVGIDDGGSADRPLAWLPRVGDDAELDGNCYFGRDRTSGTLLQIRPNGGGGGSFADLDSMRASTYFDDSRAAHPPGFEAHGRDDDPRLRRWLPVPRPVDDFRLGPGSPARQAGVPLPDATLREIDGDPPPGARPDIGCFRFGSPPMRVGVDGRRRFPGSHVHAPVPPVGTVAG